VNQLFCAHAATHARIASRPSGNGPGPSNGIGPLGLTQLRSEVFGLPIREAVGFDVSISPMLIIPA